MMDEQKEAQKTAKKMAEIGLGTMDFSSKMALTGADKKLSQVKETLLEVQATFNHVQIRNSEMKGEYRQAQRYQEEQSQKIHR